MPNDIQIAPYNIFYLIIMTVKFKQNTKINFWHKFCQFNLNFFGKFEFKNLFQSFCFTIFFFFSFFSQPRVEGVINGSGTIEGNKTDWPLHTHTLTSS